MLSQVVTNQAGQQRGNRQEVADTSRIHEFLRMNPSNFTGSSVTEDPENFMEKIQKVFEIMHIADTERVELAAYQIKGIARIWPSWGVSFPENRKRLRYESSSHLSRIL
ncbi:hypothetical protein R3W88_011510 [Solanum pinnatisectum]|uniref:Gag-pol polyprotein n=1 Tax=Solanum pinnatisectum TaxID=50273 RepID=A0AAV9L7I3_9SOLN|nr:hypothetical protein R3W88_011510 [Solanum pinnatisectum]